MGEEKAYDVVVVGAGIAGRAAAIQAAWSGLRTLVLGGFGAGGRLLLADRLEAYPGFPQGVSGWDLADALEEQAARLGAEQRADDVARADLSARPFRLWAEGEDEPLPARAVVVATGARQRRLGVPGEERLQGRGLSYCAPCDGFFFRGKRVAVVGGGDAALGEALYLTRYASEVLVVHRGERPRAAGTLLERAAGDTRVSFLAGATVQEVLGDDRVEGVRLRDAASGEGGALVVDGVIVAVGSDPHLGAFAGLLETDARGYVVRKGGTTETSLTGMFAAGEVADGRYRQAATAVGDGCKAAMDAARWLEATEGGGA